MNTWHTIELIASERQRDLQRQIRHDKLVHQVRSSEHPGVAARLISRYVLPHLRHRHPVAVEPQTT
jgi:hypothetical protein